MYKLTALSHMALTGGGISHFMFLGGQSTCIREINLISLALIAKINRDYLIYGTKVKA